MHSRPGKKVFLISLFLTLAVHLDGQVRPLLPDTVVSLPPQSDSLILQQDTMLTDTTVKQREAIDAPVDYQAADSMEIDPVAQKVYLYGDANVKYKNIELTADYIEFDMSRDEVYATGLPDSTGTVAGNPVFSEGGDSYESKILRYNFRTKKGYIQQVKTEEEGGYLHSEKTKKQPDGGIDIKDGKYTSCDADDPHYYVALTKAKVLPRNKIVSGPAYLVIADIPLPLVLPFGFFPNKKGQASGILIPEYGEEMNRGFFLRNGGYYLALGKYFDLRMTGDIYTKGTWGLRLGSQYIKKYKFSGNLDLRYYKNVAGDKDFGTDVASRDYSISWSHRQDAKSTPNSSFSANVNMSSSSYDRNHSFSTESYLTNTKSSSISFSKRWPDTPFNLSGSLNHQQNSLNKSVTLGLPKLAFNMSRIYPFRSRKRAGNTRWYDNIEFSYSARMENTIYTNDSLFLTRDMFNDMKNGFQHSIPLSFPIRPFNNFTINPNLSYSGVLYTESLEYRWNPTYINPLTNAYGKVDTIRHKGLKYAHAFQPSLSVSFNPRIYGMFQFTRPDAKIQVIRHVMQPSVSMSLTPDMRDITPDYYDTVQTNAEGTRYKVYSIFEEGIFGTPISSSGKSGTVSFSLNNIVEMKVRSARDTSDELKKVKLLESVNFSTSYNIFADSLKWSGINISGRTNLFNKINISFGGFMDFYALNQTGTRINTFQWSVNRRMGRLTRAFLSLDMSLNSQAKSASAGAVQARPAGDMAAGSEMEEEQAVRPPMRGGTPVDDYVDFTVPWNVSLRYNLNYSKARFTGDVTQTLSMSGNISLTPKWKISVSSGWDFVNNKLTYTSFNLHRDLHCWEMSFSWIPIGYHQSYTFRINVLSAILRDLKYERRKSWYDR